MISGLIFLTACNHFSTNEPDNLPRAVSDLENTMVQSNNAFGFNLLQETAASEAYGNLCISPLSVSFALGMAYNGSATVTETAMRNTLDYGNMTEAEINSTYQSLIDLLHNLDQSVIMNIANSAWCRDNFPFKEEFITALQTYFDAEVQNLDFSDPAAVDIINGWVDTKTNGKIDEIIDSIPAEAVLYLINALYFKADWTTKFDPDETAEAPFYLADGTTKNCSMMNLMSSFPYFENDTFKAVSLPYGNEQYSMTILLPKPGRTTAEAIDLLTPQNWTRWISSLASREITIQLPKFTLEYS